MCPFPESLSAIKESLNWLFLLDEGPFVCYPTPDLIDGERSNLVKNDEASDETHSCYIKSISMHQFASANRFLMEWDAIESNHRLIK